MAHSVCEYAFQFGGSPNQKHPFREEEMGFYEEILASAMIVNVRYGSGLGLPYDRCLIPLPVSGLWFAVDDTHDGYAMAAGARHQLTPCLNPLIKYHGVS